MQSPTGAGGAKQSFAGRIPKQIACETIPAPCRPPVVITVVIPEFSFRPRRTPALPIGVGGMKMSGMTTRGDGGRGFFHILRSGSASKTGALRNYRAFTPAAFSSPERIPFFSDAFP